MISSSSSVSSAAITENLLKRKWSLALLQHLESGVTDPTKILKCEPGLSMPVMNERLRALVRYGLITRLPMTTTSRSIEYRLTVRGSKVLKALEIIYQLDDNVALDHRENVAAPPTRLQPAPTPRDPSRSKTLKAL